MAGCRATGTESAPQRTVPPFESVATKLQGCSLAFASAPDDKHNLSRPHGVLFARAARVYLWALAEKEEL